MSNINLYGQVQSEKVALDNTTARKIIQEINHFGVSDRQKWLIIYFLALELENVDEMKSLTSFIKEMKGKDLFITKIFGSEESETE